MTMADQQKLDVLPARIMEMAGQEQEYVTDQVRVGALWNAAAFYALFPLMYAQLRESE